ncbi:MAG: ABC transporter ATP-binding protein [Gammaproteobacteria bacterium]|nr:ABC transporter ATP-binding protein [Gammaproteobacteria bacterium]
MNPFIVLVIATFTIAFTIPVVTYIIGRKTVDADKDPGDTRRSRALPFIGNGKIPPERDRDVSEDRHTFAAIIKLFFRSWPFIRIQLFGRWFYEGKGTSQSLADSVESDGYHYRYAPIIITVITVVGPLFEWVPASLSYPLPFLYIGVGLIVAAQWALILTEGDRRLQTALAIAIAFLVFVVNLLAVLVVDGIADNFWVAAITLFVLLGWMFQIRRVDPSQTTESSSYFVFTWRFRLHAHLAYFYLLLGIQGFIEIPMGLLMADMLAQSILQSDPLMPFVAEFFGREDLARGVAEALSIEERHMVKWWYISLMIGMWLTMLPFEITRPYYHVWIMQRINQDLRLALVERWHQLSLSYHSDHRTGDSIYRIYQDSAQVTAVIGQLVTCSIGVWRYLLAAILVSFLSPTIGLIAITIIIPALILARWAMPRMRTRSLVYRAATSDITSRIQESFAAIRLIKAYRVEDRAQREMEEDSVVAFNAAFQVRLMIALVTILMFTIAGGILLTGEFFMALYANQGNEAFAKELIAVIGLSFTVWTLGAFNWGRDQFHTTTNNVRHVMRQWLASQDMAMGLQRVFDILDIAPDIVDAPTAVPLERFEHAITFDDVAFRYQTDRPVLDGVSFTTSPGSITAIVGPTGSGKSTMMGLLLRLYDPTAGSITIDDKDLRDYTVESLRAKTAIALQENVLFALSIRDNIRYVAPDATDEQVQTAIEVACTDDYVNSLPQGLDTILGDRGGKLSTGQRQRLSIARAVVRDTPILILDEPTAALDADTEHRVMTNLAQWGEHRAIFLITHRISTIRRADNILYLDEGRIFENGDHETLMRTPNGRYRTFVETESGLAGAAAT